MRQHRFVFQWRQGERIEPARSVADKQTRFRSMCGSRATPTRTGPRFGMSPCAQSFDGGGMAFISSSVRPPDAIKSNSSSETSVRPPVMIKISSSSESCVIATS